MADAHAEHSERPERAERAERPRHFSMIRTFVAADFLTLGNGFAGTGAIFLLMQFIATSERMYLVAAFACFPVALVLDFADGRVARWRHRKSGLGKDLDSLADVISFGVAPASLAFAMGMRTALDVVVLLYFVACGISRLARFNVTAEELADDSGKVKYFEGTPIPTSLLLVGVLFAFAMLDKPIAQWGPLHPLVLLYFVSGSAMISKTLRIPKP
jgi:CDP-diacylglycerol---serine O-phosphatidyltransferase